MQGGLVVTSLHLLSCYCLGTWFDPALAVIRIYKIGEHKTGQVSLVPYIEDRRIYPAGKSSPLMSIYPQTVYTSGVPNIVPTPGSTNVPDHLGFHLHSYSSVARRVSQY